MGQVLFLQQSGQLLRTWQRLPSLLTILALLFLEVSLLCVSTVCQVGYIQPRAWDVIAPQ